MRPGYASSSAGRRAASAARRRRKRVHDVVGSHYVRTMRSTSFGSTATLATIALLLTACGGSSGGGADGGGAQQGDAAGFCDQIVALEAAADQIEGDSVDDESLDALRSLRDAAPDEVRDDMTVIIDVFEKLADIDENDPDSFEEVFGLLFDPAVVEAGENLEAYGVNECGLDPESTDTDTDTDTDSDTGSGTAAGSTGSGIDDALYDPNFDDPVDPNTVSIDGLKLYLDENHPDATWRTQLTSFSQFGDNLEAGGIDVQSDALAICAALLAYATGISADAAVGVNTFSDNFEDEISIASGNAADGCVTL